MNAKELKDIMSKDSSLIIKVLESLGYHDFWEYKTGEWRGAVKDADNKTSVSVIIETSFVKDFPNDISGDIIQFVELSRGDSFGEAMRYIQAVLGIGNKEYKKKKDVLSHFKRAKSKSKLVSIHEVEIPKYTKKEKLSKFLNLPHFELFKEAILPSTQIRFNIAYDEEKDRIIFPHFSYDDKESVVGISGRTLKSTEEIKEFDIPKYWNYINGYKKSFNLYGFSHSIDSIENNNMIIIAEAEKSVLKHNSMKREEGFTVALGGHELSYQQSQIILENTSKDVEVVIAYDKDVMMNKHKIENKEVDYPTWLKHQLRYIMPFRKVSYIYDKRGILDDKDSPFDRGFKRFHHLLKYRIELN